MKKANWITAVLLASLLQWSSLAYAKGDILPGKLGDYGRYYDVDTEESFTARVVRIHEVCYSNSSRACLALEVLPTTEEETEIVYLGSKRRIERADLQIREGADVCVVASRASIEGKNILIGKSIIAGYEEFSFRTEDGRHFNLGRRTGLVGGEAVCTIAGAADR